MATLIHVPAQIEAVKCEIHTQLEAQGDTAPGFDIDLWLQDWLRRPQPALGGRQPADLLSTEAGIASVSRVLGSILGGAYQ